MPLVKHEQVIRFHHLKRAAFQRRAQLKSVVVKILKDARRPVEAINYIFCSDGHLLDINRQYLNHDYYTDIITFDLSDPGMPLVADIYISIDRVRANARELGKSFAEELARVIFHGALHLAGYKDKTVADQKRMRTLEDEYLHLFRKKA